MKNVPVLVAIGVSQTGYRQVMAVSQCAKEDKATWTAFLRELMRDHEETIEYAKG